MVGVLSKAIWSASGGLAQHPNHRLLVAIGRQWQATQTPTSYAPKKFRNVFMMPFLVLEYP
jgi:hypothetical protein